MPAKNPQAEDQISDDDVQARSIIEPLPFDLKSSCLTIKAKCGECRYFANTPHKAYKKVCMKLGVIEKAKPCKRFSPDVSLLNFNDEKQQFMLSDIMANTSTARLALLAAVINREARTRRHGFHFGEVIYIRAFGDDYVSNYRKGRVINADSEYVYISGNRNFVAQVYHDSVIKHAQWKLKKVKLTKAGKVRDPRYKSYTQLVPEHIAKLKRDMEDAYQPPTIDFDFGKSNKPKNVKYASVARVPLDEIIRVR